MDKTLYSMDLIVPAFVWWVPRARISSISRFLEEKVCKEYQHTFYLAASKLVSRFLTDAKGATSAHDRVAPCTASYQQTPARRA